MVNNILTVLRHTISKVLYFKVRGTAHRPYDCERVQRMWCETQKDDTYDPGLKGCVLLTHNEVQEGRQRNGKIPKYTGKALPVAAQSQKPVQSKHAESD